MKTQAFTIRDSKSEVFNSPWFAKTIGEAQRMFRELTLDSKSTINKYPEDFDLYHVGTYDDNTGKFEPFDTPQHIVKAIQLKTETSKD